MKYLLLLLLPAVAFGQQKTAPDHNVRSSLIQWLPNKQSDTCLEFSIEYCKLRPSIKKGDFPVYDVVRYFHAYKLKDTVIIDSTQLYRLIEGAYYIKIAGRLFKKEDKR
jgi:hypothetical protein